MGKVDYTALAKSYNTLHYRQQLLQIVETCYGKCKTDGLSKYQLHLKINKALFSNYHGEESLKYKLATTFRKKGYVAAFEVRAKNSRADFVVINGDSKCFEVKSKIDTLRRLGKQSDDYHRIFEYNTVVIDAKHLRETECLVPAHYGIWYFEGKKRVEYRSAIKSPYLNPLAQLEVLTKKERLSLFKTAVYTEIMGEYTAQEINERLKIALKKRYEARWSFVLAHWKHILPIDLQFFFNTNVDPLLIYQD
ncbi:sce7726 family protein [Olivibacter sp. 47]|uniref:sce7726 family protein n=1 Tax=Olivibacter sp. 47 TaxID=3056486 RepID=UPI0025A3D91D|nr:sce7726 family protein [Olivibacter sp. 47]MDM8176405.1 sce7726 family protein [Olivibacter sp. 47]